MNALKYRHIICLVCAAVLLAGCEDRPDEVLGSGLVPDAEFHARARAALERYQAISFDRNVEVCGYFGFDAGGGFLASDPVLGTYDNCTVRFLPGEMVEIVASYHTHSTFDTESDSEVPSTDDLLADIAEEVFGYISTPGGRVWLVDWRRQGARQLCGLSCVLADVAFIKGDAGVIAERYTLRELERRELGL